MSEPSNPNRPSISSIEGVASRTQLPSIKDLLERAKKGADAEEVEIERQVDQILTESDEQEGEKVVVDVPLPISKNHKMNPLGEIPQVDNDIDDAFGKSFDLSGEEK